MYSFLLCIHTLTITITHNQPTTLSLYRELDNYIHVLTEDKYATTIQNTELKNKMVKLQEELVDSQALLGDLNIQLANQCDERINHVIGGGGNGIGNSNKENSYDQNSTLYTSMDYE